MPRLGATSFKTIPTGGNARDATDMLFVLDVRPNRKVVFARTRHTSYSQCLGVAAISTDSKGDKVLAPVDGPAKMYGAIVLVAVLYP